MPVKKLPIISLILQKRLLATCLTLLFFQYGYAQSRIEQSINSGWEFHRGELHGSNALDDKAVDWQAVNLPHTWNKDDVNDDVPGYYRGTGWYRKTLYIPNSWKSKNIYLCFEGANQEAEVYVNGKLAGRHVGGYTAFRFCVDDLVTFNDSVPVNRVVIKLSNRHNEDIPPLDADFSFYGGIYRNVYLLALNKVHFNADDLASPGIKIDSRVNAQSANINMEADISNASPTGKRIKVVNELCDAGGGLIGRTQNTMGIGQKKDDKISTGLTIKNPHLWSPDDPYLYHIRSKIYDAKTGALLDEVDNPLGLRWFSFSADSGFMLNGKNLKLIGACRHQDYEGLGNALPDGLQTRDMELLKQMGANFIRIAHYPQSPAILQACDRLGILASVEIPIVDRITESPAFTQNCMRMQQEMIRQNYNHPSVVIWAYMNESMIIPRYKDGTHERQRYFANIVKLAATLDSLTHREDPQRYTMISCNGDFDRYVNTGLAKVPQIVGWNLYYGWYEKNFEDLDVFLQKHHSRLPGKPLIITEYGADADIRLRSFNPQRFDKTIDYQLLYHQYYLNTIKKLPYVTGAAIWNFADFNAERRQEATPHINTKGLLTNNRQPKETYFFYQANLLKQPVLHIAADALRSGTAGVGGICKQPVNVYGNSPNITLYLNGNKLATLPTKAGMAIFDVPFLPGKNRLKATASFADKILEDAATVDFRMQPAKLTDREIPFTSINISLGDQRYFTDEKTMEIWVPEQAYTPGGWGYIGGEVFKVPGSIPYGSGKNIFGTERDAVYQTQRLGLSAFKLDVADGEYEITLHFAELLTPVTEKALVYNLNTATQKGAASTRRFDVFVNHIPIISGLSAKNYLAPQHAYMVKTNVSAQNKKGIELRFKALNGEPVLNGIQVKKVY